MEPISPTELRRLKYLQQAVESFTIEKNALEARVRAEYPEGSVSIEDDGWNLHIKITPEKVSVHNDRC